MAGVVSVHIADVGPTAALRLMLARNPVAGLAGLRHADLGLAAPLRGADRAPPQPGRVALLGFWDDDAAIDGFESTHAVASTLGGGWSARLTPLRRYGSWPGVDDELDSARHTGHTGPCVVLTLGRLHWSRAVAFFRASSRAESAASAAPGLLWGTGLARPPFVATCSLWSSTRSIVEYAYAAPEGAHPGAIAQDAERPFHHREAFVRFRPYRVAGHLDGRNPLAETASASVLQAA